MLGSITAPCFAYSSNMVEQKSTMTCCKKTQEKKFCCCKNKKTSKGCDEKSKKSCECSIACQYVITINSNSLNTAPLIFKEVKQLFSDISFHLSKGFYTIWTPPDIA